MLAETPLREIAGAALRYAMDRHDPPLQVQDLINATPAEAPISRDTISRALNGTPVSWSKIRQIEDLIDRSLADIYEDITAGDTAAIEDPTRLIDERLRRFVLTHLARANEPRDRRTDDRAS